jgi:aminoglycoside 3-N-acetyltransferase
MTAAVRTSLRRTGKAVLNKARKKVVTTILRRFGRKHTKRDLSGDLRNMGIEEGDTVVAHSSLSRLGYVQGGAMAVVEGLLQAVGADGTLVMPSFTIHGSMKETLESGFLFDPRSSQVTVGLIPETFRKLPLVYRSLHPTHSMSAHGRLAKWITEGHESCQTTFGEGTPFHKLLRINAKVLGLGVDMAPVTFYHTVEELEDDFPVEVHCPNPVNVSLLDHEGRVITMKVLPYDPLVTRTRIDQEANLWIRRFFTEQLRKKGLLHEGRVGRSHSWYVFAKDLYAFQSESAKEGVTIYTTREEYSGRH